MRSGGRDRSHPVARKLLLEHLDAAQRECYETHGHFYVTARGGRLQGFGGIEGKQPYALYDGRQVFSLDSTGHPIRSYYIWAMWNGTPLPKEDSILAQKLLLEANPGEVFKRACCNGVSFALSSDALRAGLGFPQRTIPPPQAKDPRSPTADCTASSISNPRSAARRYYYTGLRWMDG